MRGLRKEDAVHRERMLILLREQAVGPTSRRGPSVEETYCFGSFLPYSSPFTVYCELECRGFREEDENEKECEEAS